MGINTERDIGATLTIGPTSAGMVRLFIEAEGGVEVPMDFAPEEALEIAEELQAAAKIAQQGNGGGARRSRRDRRRDSGH
ncbi:MAG: DUF6324 family protein [Pseudomonadota bacterium]